MTTTTPESPPVPVALLHAAVNKRRAHLGWTWRDVEAATGLTYETFRSWAAAAANRTPHAGTLRSIEQGIGWLPKSAASVMAGGEPRVNLAWRALPGAVGDRSRVGAFVSAWLAEHGELPSLEQVITGLGVQWVDSAGYQDACTQAARDADQDRAALKALALEQADRRAALARYDSGDEWVRKIAAAVRRVLDHDLDDGVRRMLLLAAGRAVSRVLEAQIREPDDLMRMVMQAGVGLR